MIKEIIVITKHHNSFNFLMIHRKNIKHKKNLVELIYLALFEKNKLNINNNLVQIPCKLLSYNLNKGLKVNRMNKNNQEMNKKKKVKPI